MDCSPSSSSVQELSREEYWRGSLFPAPGDLPVSGTEHTSRESPAWAEGFLTIAPLRNTRVSMFLHITVQGFPLQIPPRTQGRGQTRMKGTVFSVHLFPLSSPQLWGLEKEMVIVLLKFIYWTSTVFQIVRKMKGYDAMKAIHVNCKPKNRHKQSVWLLTFQIKWLGQRGKL